ncbi:MAG: hypothetical protein KA716_32530 [Gloeotrichia echinulata DEX184]
MFEKFWAMLVTTTLALSALLCVRLAFVYDTLRERREMWVLSV